MLPFWVKGALPNMWLAFGSFDARRDTMSAYAANIGWIINWWLRGRFALPEVGFPKAFLQFVTRPLAITRFQELGYPNPRPIARTAVVAAVAWAMWLTRRSRDFAIAAALGAFTIHAFFVLSPGMHEHHQLFEVPLLALAAAMRPRLRPLFFAVSAIVALSINYALRRGAGDGMGASTDDHRHRHQRAGVIRERWSVDLVRAAAAARSGGDRIIYVAAINGTLISGELTWARQSDDYVS